MGTLEMMQRLILAILCVAWWLGTAPAGAQEHNAPATAQGAGADHAAGAAGHAAGEAAPGDAHGGHGPNYELLTIDVASAIWTIVVFIIVLIVLRAFAFKPIQRALANREKFIVDSLAQARRDRDEAEKLLNDYSAKLEKARDEASAIVEEGRRDAEVVKRTIHEEARKESDAMIARAKREIEVARDSALRDLYDTGSRLAVEVAGKVIRKEISPADHERLIQESIAELAKLEPNRN